MYIACPECDTKFSVTPEQIGKNGKKVKCSKCAHIWHQAQDTEVRIEPSLTQPIAITPLGNGVNLPALLPVKFQPYLYTIPVMMIGLIIFMFIMVFPNGLGVNSLINGNNLSIKDIQIHSQQEFGKIAVSYKIHNISDKTVKLPLVRIRLFDKNNRIIESHIDDHTNVDIPSNHIIHVKTDLVPPPSSIDSVDIMHGNKIDFMLK